MTQTAHQSRVSGRLGRGRSARSSSHGSPAARRLVAEDATYISLNFENPELKRVLPWTGTSSGPEAFISTFTRVATYWTIEAFEISDLFGSAEDVAVLGSFTYRSVSLGQAVRSPFSIHAKVKDARSPSSSSW